MKAIILAAGEGARLRPYTRDVPKCLVELAGRPLLVHQAAVLRAAGVEEIIVVTGYRADRIRALGYRTRHNAEYSRTNMVTSLMCAADVLEAGGDVIISYGDIIYEARIAAALCACDAPVSTTVDLAWLNLWRLRMDDPLSDAETLKLDAGGCIVELGRKPRSRDEIEGQYMGLIKLRGDVCRELPALYERMSASLSRDGGDAANVYMTTFLQWLIDHGRPIRAVPVHGGWLEVDTASDLQRYRRLHSNGGLDEYCRLTSSEVCTTP